MTEQTDLLIKAAEIRDADTEGENTALRVGTALVDIIQGLTEAINEESEQTRAALAQARSTLTVAIDAEASARTDSLASEASARAEAVASVEGRLTDRISRLDADTGAQLARLTPVKLPSEEAHAAMVADGSIIPGQIYYTIEDA